MKVVYVPERHGLPQTTPDGLFISTAFAQPRGVEAWYETTPIPRFQTDTIKGYVSIDELKSIAQLSPKDAHEVLLTLIQQVETTTAIPESIKKLVSP